MTSKYDYIRHTFTVDGKRYTVRGKTEAEVAVKADRKRREIAECANHSGGNQTVEQWAAECYAAYKPNISDRRRKNYESLLRQAVYPHIGKMKLRDVTPLACQQCLAANTGKSQYYINQVHQALNFIFSKAVVNRYISANPAASAVKPKGSVHHRRALTETEKVYFLDALQKSPQKLYFGAMYYTGCRPAEAAALVWDDITIIEGREFLHIRGTKTENADRLVPIPPEFSAMLDSVPPEERTGSLSVRLRGGEKPIDTDTARRSAWRAIARQINISLGCKVYRNQLVPPLPFSADITPYCLRHTYCTNLAKAGVDIRTAQKLMGHSDISLTANIYTHIDNEDLIAAADQINS